MALILSKLVLVVIFLVAVAQVSAPIDADLASISDPIAGIVLMFIAAFAPYITYKFLSFVGFDMYHAMSSEQEAKSALNRPVPVPIGTDGGQRGEDPRCGRAAAAPAATGGGAATGAGGPAAAAGAATAGAVGSGIARRRGCGSRGGDCRAEAGGAVARCGGCSDATARRRLGSLPPPSQRAVGRSA